MNVNGGVRAAAALALLTTMAPAPAAAHSRPLSYAFVRIDGDDAALRVQIAPADLAQLGFDLQAAPAQSERAGQRMQRGLTLSDSGSPCRPNGPALRAAAIDPWLSWQWTVHCRGSGERRIRAELGPLFQNGHRQLVRLDDGGRSLERVLDLADSSWSIGRAGGGAQGSALLDYVRLGFEHLLTGWDHLAFVLALLLLATRLREVIALVTSFTLAHSLSLGLATAHLVQPNPAPVEALIGFSIALLGAENCWLLAGRGKLVPVLAVIALGALAALGGANVSRIALAGLALFCSCHFALLERARDPARLRVALAFAFGVIHGFGFASALAELELPTDRLLQALFGFNVGVEIGQLVVVLALWPLLRAFARVHAEREAALFSELASAAISGLGLFWFVTRCFG